ncbi:hypothetical protein [Psychrobacter sp. I-STPA6b]|uniref:hypothetical protein n=1 Tax=Psychrobacter sp. I-STPA6b TaxID=2585718 RepID=UPI001D0C1A56|nr:hypothetical protein [Psychrobacter sp. I-STPA6b]
MIDVKNKDTMASLKGLMSALASLPESQQKMLKEASKKANRTMTPEARKQGQEITRAVFNSILDDVFEEQNKEAEIEL